MRISAIASAWLFVPSWGWAACDNRLGVVAETAWQQTSRAPLNYRAQQFLPRGTLKGEVTLDQRCQFSQRYTTQLKASAVGTFATRKAGSEQIALRANSRTYVHEAYLTAEAPGDVLIDIGKKDIRNGYLLFLSPMDILRTPINPPVDGPMNSAGPSWRTAYREGRIGMGATRFLDWGTLELAAFPALGKRPGRKPVSEWNAFQRSNDSGSIYAAYSANLWQSFNPKVVARATSRRNHTVAIGVSDEIADGVIFSLEAAHSNRSNMQRLSRRAEATFYAGGFPQRTDLLRTRHRGSQQLAAGIRINGPYKTTWIGEFYYQSDGYSKSEWDRYFKFSDATLAAYAASGFQPYLDYQRLLLAAADSDQRRNLLLGRRYLTLAVERLPDIGERWGWHVSVLGNTDDYSSLLNLHITYLLSPGIEMYLGGRAVLGRQRSEFGRFGQSPLAYLGLSFSL